MFQGYVKHRGITTRNCLLDSLKWFKQLMFLYLWMFPYRRRINGTIGSQSPYIQELHLKVPLLIIYLPPPTTTYTLFIINNFLKPLPPTSLYLVWRRSATLVVWRWLRWYYSTFSSAGQHSPSVGYPALSLCPKVFICPFPQNCETESFPLWSTLSQRETANQFCDC